MDGLRPVEDTRSEEEISLPRFEGATSGFHVLDIFAVGNATEDDRFLYRTDHPISRRKRESAQPKPLHVRNRESFEVLKRSQLLTIPGDFQHLTAPFRPTRSRKIPVNPSVFLTDLSEDDSVLHGSPGLIKEKQQQVRYAKEREYVDERKVDVRYMQFLQHRALDKYREKQERQLKRRRAGMEDRRSRGRSGRRITYKEMCQKASQLHWTRKEKRRLIMEFLNSTAAVIQKAYRAHVLRNVKGVLDQHHERSTKLIVKLRAVTKIQGFGRRCVHKLRVKQVLERQKQAATTLQNLLRKSKENKRRRQRLLANMELETAKKVVIDDHTQWLRRLNDRIEREPDRGACNTGAAMRILEDMSNMGNDILQVAEESILKSKDAHNQTERQSRVRLEKAKEIVPCFRVTDLSIKKSTASPKPRSARKLRAVSDTPATTRRVQSARRRNIFRIDNGECEAANKLLATSLQEGLRTVQDRTDAIQERIQQRKELCETYDNDYRFMQSQRSFLTRSKQPKQNLARQRLLQSYYSQV